MRRPPREAWLFFYIAGACACTFGALFGAAFFGLSWWQAIGIWLIGTVVFALLAVELKSAGAHRRLCGLASAGRAGPAASLARRERLPAGLVADAREAAGGGPVPPAPVLPRPVASLLLFPILAVLAAVGFLDLPWIDGFFLAVAGLCGGWVALDALTGVLTRRTVARLLAEGRDEAARAFAGRAQITLLLDLGLGGVFARAGRGPYRPPIEGLPALRIAPWVFGGVAAYVVVGGLPAPFGLALCAVAWYGTRFLEGARLRAGVVAALAAQAERDLLAAAETAERLEARHGPVFGGDER